MSWRLNMAREWFAEYASQEELVAAARELVRRGHEPIGG